MFEEWYESQRDATQVVENQDGERAGFQQPCRFSPEYREMQYAKAQALERELRDRWGKLLHTGMITLSASSTDDQGRWRSPVDHYEELNQSYKTVKRELNRVLEDRDSEYLAILEPHESGYVHIHIGVFVRGPIVAEQFQPVIDAHLRNCPTAGEAAHQIIDDDGNEDTVRIMSISEAERVGGIQNLGAYLASYLAGDYDSEAHEQPDFVKRFYAVMWAEGAQWFRPSNGAQEFMRPEESDDSDDNLWKQDEWEYIGLSPDGDLDDVIEIDDDEGGGVDKTRLRTDRPPD
jgi:hypothetical protein